MMYNCVFIDQYTGHSYSLCNDVTDVTHGIFLERIHTEMMMIRSYHRIRIVDSGSISTLLNLTST